MAQTGIVPTQEDLVARWMRAEKAFEIVRLRGMSLRAAAQELGVAHSTIWEDIRAYEKYLAQTEAGTINEKRAAFLQLCYRVIRMAEDTYEQAPPQSLNRTGAINTMVSVFSHIRAVQGLDVPKDQKGPAPTGIRVQWGTGDAD